MSVTYTTDYKFKSFKYRSEVPAKVLKSQFAHLSEDDGFFNYRNYWYHVSDFMRLESSSSFEDCPIRVDGYLSDSAFSGILIQVSNDGHREICYKAASFYS